MHQKKSNILIFFRNQKLTQKNINNYSLDPKTLKLNINQETEKNEEEDLGSGFVDTCKADNCILSIVSWAS